MKVLSGDIGGTNSRLALCEVGSAGVVPHAERTYPSTSFDSLAEVVRDFLSGLGADVTSACFGLPGPVRGRSARLTNLPWVVDADAMERELGISRIWLLNDLEANAHGLDVLAGDAVTLIKAGNPNPTGNGALIAAGTGLGEAGLTWHGGRRVPFATEGGHTDFGPADQFEVDLLHDLRRKHPHVSWERLVSGPGLVTIDAFLRQRATPGAQSPWRSDGATDVPAQISAAAMAGDDPIAVQAVDRFLGLYGAEAGNLALKVLATGGVYVGGGIAPKLASLVANSRFVERFAAKGRMAELLDDIPIYLVTDDRAGLWGAAKVAAWGGKAGG